MTLNRHRADDWDGEPASGNGGSSRWRSLVQALGLVLFLGGATLVFGVLAARTAGFRELAAARILEWTETPVEIRGSRLGWPCDLVFTQLTAPVKPGQETPGLLVPELRASWRPIRGLEIRMIRPSARVVQHADGSFQPVELALLGEIRNARDIAEWLAPVKRRASVRIEQGLLEVAAPDGQRLRRLEGIDLAAVPVALPGREAVHFRLSTGPMTGVDGSYRGFTQEWLAIEGVDMLEISFAVDAAGVPWARDLWKGTRP